MTDEKKTGPFGLNPIRIMILAMGALVLMISLSIIMGGPGSYQALKEASNAAKEPTAEQLQGE
ncbi:hypothetical protein O9Z70_12385 [Devosia sp. YIM 151766]|uniref:hypothetical protein n=1 Tax=Devosia sp. YIM 151766 TaxID=3017325 RepID=UPI00255C3475|nr:hypothetical protein [Devosia sp. YIM 151766]WIY52255.1 hypothetical protein O9Z70_12385 [Devosia sp. YIM 151766]